MSSELDPLPFASSDVQLPVLDHPQSPVDDGRCGKAPINYMEMLLSQVSLRTHRSSFKLSLMGSAFGHSCSLVKGTDNMM